MSAPEKVKLRHTQLGEMEVFPISVPSWLARGWQVAEDEPAPTPPPAPEPGGEQPESRPAARSRRRHSEENE